MPNLWVKETYVNATQRHQIGESGAYETFIDKPGTLYKSMQKEYGRCVSRVYVDLNDNPVTARTVGWVFLSRQKYEDARTNRPEDYYLREVWVTVLDGPDTVVRTEHHHYLD